MENTSNTAVKPSPEFLSEYSMGPFDFVRFDKWLQHIENYSARINSCAVPVFDDVEHYFAGLNVLYKSWKPLIFATVQQEMNEKIKNAKNNKRIIEENIKIGIPMNKQLVLELVDNLDEVHTQLMEIKQKIGLGIKVKRKMSVQEKIKAGIRGINNFEDLPEA